jgi:hypothetical protein
MRRERQGREEASPERLAVNRTGDAHRAQEIADGVEVFTNIARAGGGIRSVDAGAGDESGAPG